MATNKLNEEEIACFIKDMFNMTIGREQLMNPNKEFVVQTYARFLSEFGIENVTQPDLMATSAMDNIERYETNIILWNIFKSVSSIVQNAGVPDMTFADIIQPKRNRTIRILSALCLLCYKLTEIESKFSQMQAKFADLPTRREAVESRTRDLNKQINEKAIYLSNNKAKTQGLAQELKARAEAYEEKNAMADKLGKDAKQLKTQILNQREKLSELDIVLSKIKEEIHDLEQKIVKSPERIQADSAEKEQELEAKRVEKKKLEKQYMELIRTADHLKEASKTFMPSLETFTQAFKSIESMRTHCEKMYETKLEVTKREEELKTLKVQMKEQEKSISALKQQIVNNEKQYQQQIQTMKQINNGMKKDLELKTKNQTKAQKNCLNERLTLEERLDALDEEHKQFKDKWDAVNKQHKEAMAKLQEAFKSRMTDVQNVLQKRKYGSK